MTKTIFDCVSPDSAEIIFAGSCACAADDYVDIHYHVTMAWRHRFGFDKSMAELPPAQASDLLARGMVIAMELAEIGFEAQPKPMDVTTRPSFEEFVRANNYHEGRKFFIDDVIAQYHKHKERIA